MFKASFLVRTALFLLLVKTTVRLRATRSWFNKQSSDASTKIRSSNTGFLVSPFASRKYVKSTEYRGNVAILCFAMSTIPFSEELLNQIFME